MLKIKFLSLRQSYYSQFPKAVLWCCTQHRRTAAQNPETYRRRQVYGCCTIDVKQALGTDQGQSV